MTDLTLERLEELERIATLSRNNPVDHTVPGWHPDDVDSYNAACAQQALRDECQPETVLALIAAARVGAGFDAETLRWFRGALLRSASNQLAGSPDKALLLSRLTRVEAALEALLGKDGG